MSGLDSIPLDLLKQPSTFAIMRIAYALAVTTTLLFRRLLGFEPVIPPTVSVEFDDLILILGNRCTQLGELRQLPGRHRRTVETRRDRQGFLR